MITRITADNSTQYLALFSKAENLLKAGIEQNLLPQLGTTDPTEVEITTLNQYYAYLQDLVTIANNENLASEQFNPSVDLSRYFTRLPLDEEFLNIDANTRIIKIPAKFSQYGIGVQGDEMAEVVYFTIDRYFDSIDLAGDNISIIIQWEARNANKEIIQGISPNYGKDVETLPGQIIFGWPIYREFTEAAGTIKFAVRFFSVGKNSNNEDEVKYSLSTLPAELTINATINYDLLNNTLPEVDRGQIITSRITNSNINDPSIPTPGIPIISTPMYVRSANRFVPIVDLPGQGEDPLQLAISAKPRDFGAIVYTWNKWDYNPDTGSYSGSSRVMGADAIQNGVYEKVTDDIPEDVAARDIYYKDVSPEGASAQTWEVVNVDTELANLEYDEEEEGFQCTDETTYIELYKKLSVATISAVGLYTVDVTARYKTNDSKVVMAKDLEAASQYGVKVPGPLKPVITPPADDVAHGISTTIADNVTHIIVSDNSVTISPTVTKGEFGKTEEEVGNDPQVNLTYQWNAFDEHGVATAIEGKTSASLTLEDLANSGLDNAYCLDVTAERNGVETTMRSGNYRLTNAPVKPIIKMRTFKNNQFGWEVADYETTDSQPINMSKNLGAAYNKITLTVDPPALSDKVSYVWMRANIDSEDDYIEGLLHLHVELDDKLPDLFADIAAEESDNPVVEPFSLIDIPELGSSITSGEVEVGNMPVFQFNANTDEGYYYCIVINELNNNRVANVSPFFYVS